MKRKFNIFINKYNKDYKLYNNIIGTTFIKFLSLLISIISITAYSHFFNNNGVVMGTWLTMTSILNWIVNFDLGLGNGLRNKLNKYITLKDVKNQKICISSAYIMISFFSILIAIVFGIVVMLINWNLVLNVSKELIENKILIIAIIISFFGLILQFVLKLVISILYSLGKTTIGSMVSLFSHIIIVIFALTVKVDNISKGLIIISTAYALSSILPLLVTSVIVFTTILKDCRPSIHYFDRKIGIELFTLGGKFFIIQLLLLIINSTNDLIIAHINGPTAVIEYNMYLKIFSAIIALFAVITNSIWSSITESYYKKDFNEICKRERILSKITRLFFIGLILISFILQFLIDIFYGKNVLKVKLSYSIIFSLFSIVTILTNSISCIENGINKLSPQIISLVAAIILKFPLLYFLNKIDKNWIVVMIVNTIIMLIAYFIQKISLNKLMNRMKLDFNQGVNN